MIDPREMAKRFFMGVLGSFFFSAFMFFARIKAAIAIILAAVLALIGWEVRPPAEVGAAIDRKVEAAKDRVGLGHSPIPGLVGGGPILAPKTPEQAEAEREEREAERLRREGAKRDELHARAALIKFTCDDSWTDERLRLEVEKAERDAAHARERDPLLAEAAGIGMEVQASWDNPTLREKLAKARKHAEEMVSYRAAHEAWERAMDSYRKRIADGPNSCCPACKYPLRFGDAAINGKGLCPRCHAIFPRRQARATYRPPAPPREPLPPRPEQAPGPQGTLEKLKGKLGQLSPFSR